MSARRTTRFWSSIATDLVGMWCCFTSASTRVTRALSTLPPRLAEICTAASFGYRFGSEYSRLRTSTIAIATYFQRANSSMCGCAESAPGGASGFRYWVGSGRLQRALGQHGHDRGALQLDPHALGDLDQDEVLAELVHFAGDAAVGDDLVALGQLGSQLAVFLRALHLRTDHEEIHDAEQRHHHHDAGDGAGRGAGRGRLGRRRGNDQIEQGHGFTGGENPGLCHTPGAPAVPQTGSPAARRA